ncbi:MAG: hypothetical protein ACFFAE_17615 [Candidatus Hodarchaeota archaeon]
MKVILEKDPGSDIVVIFIVQVIPVVGIVGVVISVVEIVGVDSPVAVTITMIVSLTKFPPSS